MRKKPRVTRTLTVCSVLLALLVAPSVASAGPRGPTEPARADEGHDEDPSVLSLMADYGVTAEQGRAQMEQQVAAGEAEMDLPPYLLASYSGRQIDHGSGGAVTVALTDMSFAADIQGHFAAYGVTDVTIRLAPLSQAAADDLVRLHTERLRAARPDGSPPMISVGVRSLGMVTLTVARGR